MVLKVNKTYKQTPINEQTNKQTKQQKQSQIVLAAQHDIHIIALMVKKPPKNKQTNKQKIIPKSSGQPTTVTTWL